MKKFSTAIALSCLLSSTAFATSLSEALAYTYQNNPELIAQREKQKVTDEQMFQAISGFLPKVYYEARKTNEKQDTTTSGINGLLTGQKTKIDDWQDTKAKRSSVNLEQNLFNGGRDVMAVRIAKYTIEAGRSDLVSKEQEILLKAINAYLDIIKYQEMLQISKENLQAYEKKYQSVKDKYEVGVAKKADLADASARKANAETTLTIVNGKYNAALASYVQIIGLEPENIVPSENLTTLPTNQAELLQKALQANPELLNVTAQKKAYDLNVVSNAAALLPQVDLVGSMGKNWQNTRGSAINQPYTNTKAVYVSVTVPLYQKGKEYSNIRSSSAQSAQYKYALKNAKASVTQSATQSWSDYISAQDSVKSGKEAVNAAQIALEAKQQEYNEGVETLSNLLDAQENLFQYRMKLTQVEQEAHLSYYKMASLMGKLTAKELALPTKIYNPSDNYDRVKMELIGF